MKKLVSLIALAGLLAGCSSTGEMMGRDTRAGVSLERKNYQVVKAGAKGDSTGFNFLGIIPFARVTYAEAKEELYASVGQKLEGRAVALVNQTEDRSFLYFILFSLPKLTLTADVIEYTDMPQAGPATTK